MKLIVCIKCSDVVKAGDGEWRYCACGKSGARYVDDLNAEFGGQCVPIGFHNVFLVNAIKNKNKATADKGINFEAFVISPTKCKTFRRAKLPAKEHA